MPPMPPLEAFESVLDHELPPVARERRRDMRRTFYAMVLRELDAGRMTRRRRAQLRQYGHEIGIDPMDVQLLMTGAEYRCGYCPRSGLLERAAPRSSEFLLKPEESQTGFASLILAAVAWSACLGAIAWWLSR